MESRIDRLIEYILVGELTTVSALLDDPNSVSIIPAGETTTNIAKTYAKKPSSKFPYKITKNSKGTKVSYKKGDKTSEKKSSKKDTKPQGIVKDWANDIKGMFKNPTLLKKLLTSKEGFKG